MIRFPTTWLKATILLVVFIGPLSAQEKGPVSTSETMGKGSQPDRDTKARSPEPAGDLPAATPSNVPSSQEKTTERPEGTRASSGRRDPFRPFTTAPRGGTRRRENLTPLERYELGQLKLVAVIWDLKEPSALVEDAAGLGYIVKAGTPIGINEGKVKAIKPGELIIEETYVDVYGAKKKRETSMLLNVEAAP
jgi:Tfp pilus assembly protein PilP